MVQLGDSGSPSIVPFGILLLPFGFGLGLSRIKEKAYSAYSYSNIKATLIVLRYSYRTRRGLPRIATFAKSHREDPDAIRGLACPISQSWLLLTRPSSFGFRV